MQVTKTPVVYKWN